jgi:hypothetical protein
MKILFILTILLLLTTSLLSTTWIINQDGTGDFTTISAGITVAVDGDILLVYPGIYYERINYQGKNITITSLYDGDQYDESYIASTVIDGNHEGTVVRFSNNETRNAVLNGFTIRNGLGEFHAGPLSTRGGGIFIRNASPTISCCRIKKNRAYAGAGISLIVSGNPLLKGNVISHNHSVGNGGLTTGLGTTVEFCNVELNNIYHNYGGRAADLFLGGTQQASVIIDTMTVANPDRYFVVYNQNVPQNFELIVNHGIIEPVAADLYVSPLGSDENSGLTPEDPLQTIAMAMVKIAPDSLQQQTVHLAEGIYSRSLNNQFFPIQVRSFVDVIGASRETTILDMEEETLAFYGQIHATSHYPDNDPVNRVRNFKLKNMKLINGGNPMGGMGSGAIRLYYGHSFTFENMDIENCHTGNTPQVVFGTWTVYIIQGSDFTMKNFNIYNSSGYDAIFLSSESGIDLNFYGENIRVRNQNPGPWNPGYDGGTGGAIALSARHVPPFEPSSLDATLVHIEVTDCLIDNIDPFWEPVGAFLGFIGPSGSARIINATIGNNYSPELSVAGVGLSGSIDYTLINSIIYGNLPYELGLINNNAITSNVTISHSLIGGGENGLYHHGNPNTIVHWGEGNLDTDPLWMGDTFPDYPYMLTENSPARNAGTLDIPDFEFPEFDLAGNPRIYGDSIDMGAYEWNPVSVEEDFLSDGLPTAHDYKLYNYPNPVVALQSDGRRGGSTGTSISFQLPEDGHVAIDIYNLKGQFVRRVVDAYMRKGEHNAFWDGRDDLERYVATGFYMYKLEIDGKMVATGRCTFIK